jgi:transcriptional repressor NrdR
MSHGLRCPHCGTLGRSRVLDTGPDSRGGIRRRRECIKCRHRFNTTEHVVRATPLIIKGNGSREEFDRPKLVKGIRIACAKRPVAAIDIDRLVDSIEERLLQLGKAEVQSRIIGDMVIEGLKALDPIAYIRYAIVYLGLNNLESVRREIDYLLAENVSDDPAPDDTVVSGVSSQ